MIKNARVGALLAVAALGAALPAFADETEPSSSAWEFLRTKYYGDKPMGLVDESYLSIDAPANTPDPAATPLTIKLKDDAARRIKRLRVFIDNNPSPLVATIDLGPAPVTEIDTRVRIDRFTSVRVIAETADGALEMRSVWVKASGGCSAPPTATSGGALGEIRLRPASDSKSVLINVRHPNSSGFQIDPRSGDNIPPHYISHLKIDSAGGMLLDAELGISISENPTLRIASDEVLPAPLGVDAVDSVTQAHYTAGTQSSRGSEPPPSASNGDR
jgi:sulfur-oxidizing protein SoxY